MSGYREYKRRAKIAAWVAFVGAVVIVITCWLLSRWLDEYLLWAAIPANLVYGYHAKTISFHLFG